MVNLSIAGGGAPGYGAIRLVTRSIALPVARCQSERLVGEEQRDLRWGVERRLEFIEFRLFWEGHVNRSDLINSFGTLCSRRRPSLNRYLGLAPANMVYDKSGKAYVRGAETRPNIPAAGRKSLSFSAQVDGRWPPSTEGNLDWSVPGVRHYANADAFRRRQNTALGRCRHPCR